MGEDFMAEAEIADLRAEIARLREALERIQKDALEMEQKSVGEDYAYERGRIDAVQEVLDTQARETGLSPDISKPVGWDTQAGEER